MHTCAPVDNMNRLDTTLWKKKNNVQQCPKRVDALANGANTRVYGTGGNSIQDVLVQNTTSSTQVHTNLAGNSPWLQPSRSTTRWGKKHGQGWEYTYKIHKHSTLLQCTCQKRNQRFHTMIPRTPEQDKIWIAFRVPTCLSCAAQVQPRLIRCCALLPPVPRMPISMQRTHHRRS